MSYSTWSRFLQNKFVYFGEILVGWLAFSKMLFLLIEGQNNILSYLPQPLVFFGF